MTNRLGPYELNTIVTGECSALMATLPDGCIDLTVTSPPYDSLRTYNGYTFDFEPIARQLWRVTKEGGVAVWVVGDETVNFNESGNSFEQALFFRQLGFCLETMIYEKQNPTWNESSRRYKQSFEFMFILSRGGPKVFNPIRDVKINNLRSRKVPANRNGNKHYELYVPKNEQTVRDNIFRYIPGSSTTTESFDHPAPFPEALARDHILSWSNPGDLVLDPMVGSGTTAKQAHLLGRHYLGFEISEEYCELARRRLAGVEAQPFLMPVVSEVNGQPEQAAMDLAA